MKRNILDLSFEKLTQYLKSINERPFRATQIFEWIYKKSAEDFDCMSNLSSDLRGKLKNDFIFAKPELIKKEVSRDRTVKFLFQLSDKEKIETALIPTLKRITVCVSTQVGCKFHCRFCASGLKGFKRNLSCAEIVNQILYVKKYLKKRSLSHIVFMGIGEPLDNYDSLIKAIRIINSSNGMKIAARRITISTCGLIPQINQLIKEGMQIELAISLHGSSDKVRDFLIPVNKKYPLKELIQSCRDYIKATKRQVTFEYILIKGLTCTRGTADELGMLLRGMNCKMNLIPYNKIAEFGFEPPGKLEMLSFKQRLSEKKIHATVRMPRGRDIKAACGQLMSA